MKYYLSFFTAILFFVQTTHAQEKWSLERCINYAHENNIELKQQELNAEMNEHSYKQSYLNMLPTANAGVSENISFGRALDETTYEFTENETVISGNLNLSTSLTLFNGLQKYNTVQKQKFNLQASLQDVEQFKNDISLNIASAYLQILFNKELLQNAGNQLEVIQQQVEQTSQLVEAGSLAEGSLLEIEAQMASEELQVVNAENQLEMSVLNLKQLLDLGEAEAFDIVVPEIQIDEAPVLAGVSEVYENALALYPMIKSAEYSLQSSKEDLQIAKGGRSPSLNMNFSYGTGYSDIRERVSSFETVQIPFGETAGGETVFVTQQNPLLETYPVMDQLSDNASKTLSFTLGIPIFNGWQVNTNINSAKIGVMNAEYNLKRSKNQLYKSIQQAHADARAALKRYYAAGKTVNSMQEAFRYTQQKYEVGLVNTIEYNNAKNQLMEAQSQQLQSKFEYIFKKSILDFYMGNPIIL